jgi:aminoglycoside phosphotransferase (APT) family kinase protein
MAHSPPDVTLPGAVLDLEPSLISSLATKMQKRSSGTYKPRDEAEVQALLHSFVQMQQGYATHRVENVARLAGGASKEQFRFDVIAPDGGSERMVLRMDPLASTVATSRLREFQAMRAFEHVVPVPRVTWLDADGNHFGAPALVAAFVRGVTKPAGAPGGNVAGLGTNVGPEWRDVLSEPFIRHLVAIQDFDWRKADLSSYAIPDADPHQAARRQIDWWTQVWLEDAVDPDPMVPAVEGWLRDNMPECSDIVFCHSDYRTGNYLIDEEQRTISAILDWELSHLGDFHDDVAWVTGKIFGHLDERGEFLVSGLMPRQQFLDRYMQMSGRTIDPKTLHFYEVLCGYKTCVIILGTAYRLAVEAQNHQNVLQTWMVPCGHVFMSEICRLIDKGPST